MVSIVHRVRLSSEPDAGTKLGGASVLTTILTTIKTIHPIAMDTEGSVSMALRDALRILLRNVQPSLPPELIFLILSFLPKPEFREPAKRNWRTWTQNAALCHRSEELWQTEWLVSLAKVNRQLDELLRPLIWTNVAIYCDTGVEKIAWIERLRRHLEQNPADRRSIRRLTLDLTVNHDYLVRLGYPFDNVEEFIEETTQLGWPFESIEAYEEECIRLASIFPEHLRTLQVNCGQLRLPSSAWSHIANRCPSLAILRVDANAEDHACEFTNDMAGGRPLVDTFDLQSARTLDILMRMTALKSAATLERTTHSIWYDRSEG